MPDDKTSTNARVLGRVRMRLYSPRHMPSELANHGPRVDLSGGLCSKSDLTWPSVDMPFLQACMRGVLCSAVAMLV
jgi:hypothetical protein